MMAACDCYVSLHRSEGLGLTMAEAMALGKPVVATGWSGNLEFMSDETAYLVRYEMTRLERAHGPYPAGAEWADPDLDHAAELMRGVFDEREAAAAARRTGAEVDRGASRHRSRRRRSSGNASRRSGSVRRSACRGARDRRCPRGRARARVALARLGRELGSRLEPRLRRPARAAGHAAQQSSHTHGVRPSSMGCSSRRPSSRVVLWKSCEAASSRWKSRCSACRRWPRKRRAASSNWMSARRHAGARSTLCAMISRGSISNCTRPPPSAIPSLLRLRDEDGREVIGFEGGASYDPNAVYLGFENVFRSRRGGRRRTPAHLRGRVARARTRPRRRLGPRRAARSTRRGRRDRAGRGQRRGHGRSSAGRKDMTSRSATPSPTSVRFRRQASARSSARSSSSI